MISSLWQILQAHPLWTGILAFSSVLMLAGSVLLTPWILLRLPHDYFHNPRHRPMESLRPRPALRILLLILKNSVGLLLLIAGLGMLVLPGQGLLTLLVAFILLDFPGKFALKCNFISRPRLQKAINHYRQKHGRAPFSP